MKTFSKRQVWFALLLCAVVAVWFLARDDESRGTAEWLGCPPVQRPRLGFLGRWYWPMKRQLLRVREGLFGPPKLVTIAGTILEFDSWYPLTNRSEASVTLTNMAGSQLFVSADVDALSNRFLAQPGVRIISTPRVVVGDRVQAQVAVGESVNVGTNLPPQWVGSWLDIWPRVDTHSIDLSCFLTVSERAPKPAGSADAAATNRFVIRTNAALGARVRVPQGGGVLLISGSTNQNGSRAAVMLLPTVVNPAGR